MPLKKTIEAAKKDRAENKSPSTQAGEFVKEQIDKIRAGKHGARSAKQAIAIGLSEARRAGIELKAPSKKKYSAEVVSKAEHDLQAGQNDPNHRPNPNRSRAAQKALKRESSESVNREALAQQGRTAAKKRSRLERSEAAHRAAMSRSPEERAASARKAATTRRKNQQSGS